MPETATGEHKHCYVRVQSSLAKTEHFVSHIVIVLLHLIIPFNLHFVFKGFSSEFYFKLEVLQGCFRKGGEIEKN